jgi:hypothetical protein
MRAAAALLGDRRREGLSLAYGDMAAYYGHEFDNGRRDPAALEHGQARRRVLKANGAQKSRDKPTDLAVPTDLFTSTFDATPLPRLLRIA